MEWLKKLLEGKGLSEEQIQAIVEGVESNYKGHVPKHRFDEVNEAKKQLETDLKDRDKQLNNLKKSAGDNEGLKQQIEELQKANKAASEEYAAKIKDMQVSTAVKLALQGKVHDAEDIIKLLDMNALEVDDSGALKSNVDDLLKPIKESKPYLFVEEKTTQDTQTTINGAQPAGTGAGNSKTYTPEQVGQMSMSEYRAYREAQGNFPRN